GVGIVRSRMPSDDDVRRRLIAHLRTHAVRTDGPFTLRSGAVSDWYIDARKTTFDGPGASAVGDAVLAALDSSVVAVGGMTMGADPIALATVIRAADRQRHLRAFSIRKEEKPHGTGGRLVGPVVAGDVVAIVDDTVTTGGALAESIQVALGAGLVIAQVLALVDRSNGVVTERVQAAGFEFSALVDVSELGVGT
ncbi:MAG: orotate phosphoribosyltransferase, partial [Acidimicrobiia bacterium]